MRFSAKKVAIGLPSAARMTLCSDGSGMASSLGRSPKSCVEAVVTAPTAPAAGMTSPAATTPPRPETSTNVSSMISSCFGLTARPDGDGAGDMGSGYVAPSVLGRSRWGRPDGGPGAIRRAVRGFPDP